MKLFKNKLLLTEVKKEKKGLVYEDKDEVKLGKVAFPFEGESIKLKKGDEVYYQYGNNVTIEGIEYILASESSLICQK